MSCLKCLLLLNNSNILIYIYFETYVNKKAQFQKIKTILLKLSKIAKRRNQSLPQMALSWVLRHKNITSALIGARTVEQLDECLDSQKNLIFSSEELKEIDKYAKEEKINLWAKSSND